MGSYCMCLYIRMVLELKSKNYVNVFNEYEDFVEN